MIIRNASIFNENGRFENGDIVIRDSLVYELKIKNSNDYDKQYEVGSGYGDNIPVIDASGLYAIPGLTDIHFHGCTGYDFCDGTKKAFNAIAKYQAYNGVTTICPATMTLPEENLSDICRSAAAYANDAYTNECGSILCGINMEGPYLSAQKKGAQNEAYLHKPDIEMFRKLYALSGNMIKLVSIAPEEPGAMEFISELKETVKLSLAHTAADYDTAVGALQKGASHVTHLFNAMQPFHHRDPGVVGAAFDTPDCSVELICDGIHLHPSMVRAALQMFGNDRVVFISDSMMAAGYPDGKYTLGGQKVTVTGTKAVLEDGTIAGSVTNLMDCMRNAVINMGIPLETAVKAAAVNPAKVIGIYDHYGSIKPGKIANIVLIDEELKIAKVILKGIEFR